MIKIIIIFIKKLLETLNLEIVQIDKYLPRPESGNRLCGFIYRSKSKIDKSFLHSDRIF